ncbi:MAG: glycoside hydrolase family 32 protein [Microbacterium sp.]
MHFAPARNWLNDPNGLVFHNGRYHLFFQHNPQGATHAHIGWGHATSVDLVSWEEQPMALECTEDYQVYSGSVVFDEHNTSSLGVAGLAPLIAVFTLDDSHCAHQTQAIASSVDGGFTWAMYEGNPVLDRHSPDFRDPKVFRYAGEAGEYWVMVAVEALQRKVVLYRSDDLKAWSLLSEYGPRGASEGVWECPDLFPLAVDDDPDDVRWVLLISMNPGGIAGGSGTMYVVGSFDGVTFTPDEPQPRVGTPGRMLSRDELDRELWLDYGRDCYAGVTFSGLPDEERTLIAWMSNWDYARRLPVEPGREQRGRMTLARRLSLTVIEGRAQLRQHPIGPALAPAVAQEARAVRDPLELPELPEAGRIMIEVEFARARGFELRLGDDPPIVLSVDAVLGELCVDRTAAAVGFPDSFASIERMPVIGRTRCEIVIWRDQGSLEVFVDGGARVLTDLTGSSRGVSASIRGIDGEIGVLRYEAAPIASDRAGD